MRRQVLSMAMWLALVSVVLIVGCGVVTNAKYSQILDRTVALSNESAVRAQNGTLTQAEMVQILVLQARTWQLFADARDGAAPNDPTAVIISIMANEPCETAVKQ